MRLSFLALFADAGQRRNELALLGDLARRFGVAPPQPEVVTIAPISDRFA